MRSTTSSLLLSFFILVELFSSSQWILNNNNFAYAIQLRTVAKIPRSALSVQDYISRPIHWPEFVLSSNRVSIIGNGKKNKNNDNSQVLTKGIKVEEYFGMNLLFVEWTCLRNVPGKFVVTSDGLSGIASNCKMEFTFQEDTASAEVQMIMEYTPESILAILATPILVVDNWVALNILLKAAVDPTPLASFRKLMGTLYGIAGIGHFLDVTIGGSQLFQQVSIPPFEDLPTEGQIYAIIWCLVGPIAYLLSKQQQQQQQQISEISDFKSTPINLGDVGIVLYGLVEVFGAYLTLQPEVLMNAIVVQCIVASAWIYSYQKDASIQTTSNKKQSIVSTNSR
jgi:hypothetical protein